MGQVRNPADLARLLWAAARGDRVEPLKAAISLESAYFAISMCARWTDQPDVRPKRQVHS